MPIELPNSEFEILRDDEVEIVVYDKVVDKLYTCTKNPPIWGFPAGSRMEAILKLIGFPVDWG